MKKLIFRWNILFFYPPVHLCIHPFKNSYFESCIWIEQFSSWFLISKQWTQCSEFTEIFLSITDLLKFRIRHSFVIRVDVGLSSEKTVALTLSPFSIPGFLSTWACSAHFDILYPAVATRWQYFSNQGISALIWHKYLHPRTQKKLLFIYKSPSQIPGNKNCPCEKKGTGLIHCYSQASYLFHKLLLYWLPLW